MSNTVAREVFAMNNGPGPWPCYDCCEPVYAITTHDGVVHHLDENPKHNVPWNLVAMHRVCHSRVHRTGKVNGPKTRAKLSGLLRGRQFSDETRARMSEAAKRRWSSQEERDKQAARRRKRT